MISIPFLDQWSKDREKRKDEFRLSDSVDRLHCDSTVFILLIFTLVVSTLHFGSPIDCQTPEEVEKSRWTPYVEEYCFVMGTYRFERGQMETQPYRSDDRVGYYQWVPILLAFQVVCFAMPYILWEFVQSCLYVDMKTVISEVAGIPGEPAKRKEKVEKVAEYMFNCFYYRHVSRSGWLACVWRGPSVASVSYLIMKLLNLANCIWQFFSVCLMLGADIFWGVKEVMGGGGGSGFINGSSRNSSFSYFPKEVRCNYAMAVQDLNHGIVLNHSPTQCILTINVINEKLFLFLYFWYLFLITVTFMNIIAYLWEWRSKEPVMRYVSENEDSAVYRLRLEPHMRNFNNVFLGSDGRLLLKFIGRGVGSIASSAVLKQLWELFGKKKGLFDDASSRLLDDASSRDGDYTVLPHKTAAGDGYDA